MADNKKTHVVKGYKSPIVNERFLTTVLRVLASSKELNRRMLNNIFRFLTIIDRNHYSRDYVVGAILQALDLVLQSRLDGTFDQNSTQYSKDTVLNKLTNSMSPMFSETKNNIILPIAMMWDAKDKDVSTVDETIETYVKHAEILKRKDDVADVITDLSSGNVSNMKAAIKNLENIISELGQEFRNTTSLGSQKDFVHLMAEDFPDNYLREVFRKHKSPKANLKTGLKMLDAFLSEGGGFVAGKYYMIYADVNSFKSALLQHISRWIQKFNHRTFVTRKLETKKIPTVLHLNLENFLQEDSERFYKMYTGHNFGETQTFEQLKNTWIQSTGESGSCIDITLVHRDADEVNVQDIDAMIDSLDDEGYEVIAVVVDYIELLRCEDNDRGKEKREQLSSTSAKLHALAGRRDIPVISAHQINREGQRVINEAKAKGQTDVIRLLNRSYIGEAMAIDKKTDFSMFIGLEKGKDGKVYLGFKRDKVRYRRTDVDYMVHEILHGIYIEDDANLAADVILSKGEIPKMNGTDEMTFTGSTPAASGSRGITSLNQGAKKDTPDMQTVTVSKANWIKEIDDKPMDALFLFAYALMGRSDPMYPDEMWLEEIDGDMFYFDNIYVTGHHEADLMQ